MKALNVILGAAAACALSLGVAQADQLQDIKARGKLICGTLGTSEPFSYQDPKTREIIGYDVAMCDHIAKSLGVPLELKAISVDARIPELTQGRVDILAANLGWTKARAEQIDYSYSYFVSQQKILVRRDSKIETLDQLKGQKISAVKGSSSEQGVRREIPNAQTLTYQDGSASFLALQQGKVNGFCASELVLVKLKAQTEASANPVDIIRKSLFVEPWGLGIRKGEPAFLKHVNGVLTQMEQSGEAARVFEQWFGPTSAYRLERDFKIEEIKG